MRNHGNSDTVHNRSVHSYVNSYVNFRWSCPTCEGQVCPPRCEPLLRPVGGRDIRSPRPGSSPISAGPGTSAQGGNRRTKIPPVSAAAIVSGSAAGKCRGGAGNPEGIHGLWVGWVLTLLLCLFVCLFVCLYAVINLL